MPDSRLLRAAYSVPRIRCTARRGRVASRAQPRIDACICGHLCDRGPRCDHSVFLNRPHGLLLLLEQSNSRVYMYKRRYVRVHAKGVMRYVVEMCQAKLPWYMYRSTRIQLPHCPWGCLVVQRWLLVALLIPVQCVLARANPIRERHPPPTAVLDSYE